jgi:GT2 family glycosyltransferase
VRITALLVSHDGGRWLPQVVSALESSNRRPDAITTVDTGSTDDSPEVLRVAFGRDPVRLPPDATYAAAVRAGLEATPWSDTDEWIWLLHDDCAPAPHCLERLADTAAAAPEDVAVVGPKLREWPSLRRLLEVGVTLSGSGRRETGLEPGEYDQGQHDGVDTVLAVNTAGMLVRRRVLEEVGFAPELALFGNDVDFCWRLAHRGHQVRVDPRAVMFHVEAAHRSRRTGPLAARPRRDERAAAMFTLLTNGSARSHPLRLVRLFLGGLLRALGFLLVRAVGEARAEVAAVVAVYAHPVRLHRARRRRRREATVADRDLRHLLPPVWMPWRHGLDFVVDLARALVHLGRESLDRRRGQRPAAGRAGRGRSAESLPERMLRSPSVWALVVAVVVALVAGRDLLHGPPLHGGALLPAPGGVGHWWSTWADSWHWIGPGSAAPGPAYLLPLALVGTVLFGQPGLVVWLLFCMTVPLAMLGALRFFRRLTTGGWAPVWGAGAYALLPVLSGAVSQGRLGTVAAAVLVPWAATAALGLGDDDPDRRARAAWRTGLLVALLVAFVPPLLLLVLALLPLAGLLGAGQATRSQLAAVAAIPVLFCVPWWPAVVSAPASLLVEAGRAASVPVHPSTWQLLGGSSGGPGSAPSWLTLGIPFAALVALTRTDTRARVARPWLVAAAAAVLLAVLARVEVSLPGVPQDFRPWSGAVLLVVFGALLTAVVLASDDVARVVGAASFGWRQPLAVLALVGGLLAPIGGTAWWLAHGTERPLHRSTTAEVPAYMSELAGARHDSAALVLRGGPGVARHRTVEYRVARGPHLTLGDDGVLAVTEPRAELTATVSALLGGTTTGPAETLARQGVAYVFADVPVSPDVAGALDAADGFEAASAPRPRTRAWRVVPTPSLADVDSTGSRLRPALLAIQLLTLVGGVVLALPSRPELRGADA